MNETSGGQGWKKELLGGGVAVVLLNMGSGSPDGGLPPPAGGDGCGWNHTVGSYTDACGGRAGDVYCGDLGAVEEAKQRPVQPNNPRLALCGAHS